MERINTISRAVDLFGPGKSGYQPGNPTTGIPATSMSAEALNAMQEEIARAIEGAGMALDPANNAQLLAAIQSLITNRNISGLVRSLTPIGGALIREWADTVAATTGNIEFGISYNCMVDPVSGVWAGRDIADICWLERWSDIGGQKELWGAPMAAAGVVPAWVKVFTLDMVGGGMYLAQEAGRIAFFARSTAPAGYLKANGAAISRTAYANLYTAIGTTFGVGDGATTFNLPDLRGEFLRGFDDARGIDTGRLIGSWQADGLANHSHGGFYNGPNGSGNSYINGPGAIAASSGTGAFPTTVSASHDGIAANGFRTSTTLGSVSDTRPRNIALLACVKY